VLTSEPEGEIDVGPLLDGFGDECLLEVLATSGYHAAAEWSEPFRVRPRKAAILAWSSPAVGRVARGRPVELFAIAGRGAAPASEISWYSDVDGELGEGVRVLVTLRPGHHRIEARNRSPFEWPAVLELDVD
jgi:hypothetical protein